MNNEAKAKPTKQQKIQATTKSLFLYFKICKQIHKNG